MGRCEGIVGSVFQNISGNRQPIAAHFPPPPGPAAAYIGTVDKTPLRWLRLLVCTALAAGAALAHAQPSIQHWVAVAERFAAAELRASGAGRHEVIAGSLDKRLRLAPCAEAQPYVPHGVRLLGKTRVGLRCVKGITNWNVYLPLTVNVYGPALVSRSALPAGHVLAAGDFQLAEVNLADSPREAPIHDPELLLGRTLARVVEPGQGLRASSLRARQWFAAGETVRIRVAGQGFAVAGHGQALTTGMEGQVARVRTDNGRVVTGLPVADRLLEIAL